jgi:hypothetical protein
MADSDQIPQRAYAVCVVVVAVLLLLAMLAVLLAFLVVMHGIASTL